MPGETDRVCITLDGTYEVTVLGFDVQSLTLGAASNTGTQTLTKTGGNFVLGDESSTVEASGDLWWINGTLFSGTLTNKGLVRFGGGNVGISTTTTSTGALFRNESTVQVGDAPVFVSGPNARIENAALWDIQGDGGIQGFIAALSVFENEVSGTLRKSGGTGASVIFSGNIRFDNAGAIEVQTGELRIDAPSAHTDVTFAVSAGALLRFGSGGAAFFGTLRGARRASSRSTTTSPRRTV